MWILYPSGWVKPAVASHRIEQRSKSKHKFGRIIGTGRTMQCFWWWFVNRPIRMNSDGSKSHMKTPLKSLFPRWPRASCRQGHVLYANPIVGQHLDLLRRPECWDRAQSFHCQRPKAITHQRHGVDTILVCLKLRWYDRIDFSHGANQECKTY